MYIEIHVMHFFKKLVNLRIKPKTFPKSRTDFSINWTFKTCQLWQIIRNPHYSVSFVETTLLFIGAKIFISDFDKHTVMLCPITVSVNLVLVVVLKTAPPCWLLHEMSNNYLNTHRRNRYEIDNNDNIYWAKLNK